MANDRIWLVHKETGKRKLLFKYYPNGQGHLYDADALQAFINEQLDACGMNLQGDPRFTLETESDSPQTAPPVLDR